MAEVISLAARRQQKADAARAHAEQQAAAKAAADAKNINRSGTEAQKRAYALNMRSARQLAELVLGATHCIKSDLTVVSEDTVRFIVGDANVSREVTIQIKDPA